MIRSRDDKGSWLVGSGGGRSGVGKNCNIVTYHCPRQGLRLGTTVSLHGRCNNDDKNEIIILIYL